MAATIRTAIGGGYPPARFQLMARGSVHRNGAAWWIADSPLPAGRKTTVRVWDFAATEVKPGTQPDWTVGLRMSVVDDVFYVEHVNRGQWKPSMLETTLTNTASQDGIEVTVRMPQDPGAAGKADAATKIKLLKGYAVVAVPPIGEKSVRARPPSAQAEAGNVDVMGWTTPAPA